MPGQLVTEWESLLQRLAHHDIVVDQISSPRSLDDIAQLELFYSLDQLAPGWPTDLLESLETWDDVRWFLERRAL